MACHPRVHPIPCALLLIAMGLPVFGGSGLLGRMVFSPQGHFEFEKIPFKLTHWSPSFQVVMQDRGVKVDEGFPKRSAERFETAGLFETRTGALRLLQVASAEGDGGARLEYRASSDEPVKTGELSLSFSLQAGDFAGRELVLGNKTLVLPAKWEKTVLFGQSGLERLVIPLPSGARLTIEGPLELRLQDDREFNVSAFSIRIKFQPGKGEITESSLMLRFRLEEDPSQAASGEGIPRKAPVFVDLAAAANMAFADEVEGDRKGGWTDQGKENDLRGMKPGDLAIGGFRFQILDPAKNGGRSCLVFSGPQRDYFLKEANIPTGGEAFSWLNLLHTTAWTPKDGLVGTIHVAYQDGERAEIPVNAGIDVGNWWAATSLSNGHVGWTMENRQAFVGLYVSKFKLRAKPIRELRLVPSGRAVWSVIALTGTSESLPFPVSQSEYIVAGPQWKAIKHESYAIAPGSILDLSAHVEAGPAGKWGRVRIGTDGRFAFEARPGQAARFLGPNFTFGANFIDKPEDAEALAQNLRRRGYNCARFHHYDGGLVCETLWGDDKGSGPDRFRPDRIAKFDHTFAALKAAGIYSTIDLYTLRPFKAAAIPEYGKDGSQEIKALIPLFDSAFEDWRRFAVAFLEHVNPHTGLAYKEDPALFAICLVNEDTIYAQWNKTPVGKAAYEKRFAEWAKGRPAPEVADRDAAFNLFLTDLQVAANERMMAALRKIGVKALFSGANYHNPMLGARLRAPYDYVDNHTYWDHPTFPEAEWKTPVGVAQRSALTSMAGTPRDIMATRLFGKPFAVTEYCYSFPNHTRAEGGPIFGAYAALQGWDLLNRFDLALYGDRPLDVNRPAGSFTTTRDPVSLLTEGIISLLYLRGDVKTAASSAAFVVTPELARRAEALNNFPAEFQQMGLVARIGSVDATRGALHAPPDALLCTVDEAFTPPASGRRVSRLEGRGAPAFARAGGVDTDAGKAASETGEIHLDAGAKTFRVLTPRSEAFVRYGRGALEGKTAKVEWLDGNFATVFVTSMDGADLAGSKRLAIYVITDAQNNKIRFRDPNHLLVDSWGELPVLVRAGEVRITLDLGGRAAKVFAADLTGARMEPVPCELKSGKCVFTAATHLKSGVRMVWEVTVE